MLKLVLGIVGFVLALLGVVTKTTHDEGDRILKRPTWTGWIVLLLLVASLGLSLVLEWHTLRRGEAQAKKEDLWKIADARMTLLAQNVEKPLCAFISDLNTRARSDSPDLNALFFGDALDSAEELVAHFDLKCSPGGDWTVVGMFAKDRPTKPCFSSNRGICNAGVLFWSSENSEVARIKIVDKWEDPINAARWMAGYPIGTEVAKLTYYQRRELRGNALTPEAYWRQLFGTSELLFAVDTRAGLWLRIPLRLGNIEHGDSEVRLSWFAADQPRIGLVQ